jgi:peroxiredoxin
LLLRDRGADLAAAGIRTFGISRDSPWSHTAWAGTMGVENVTLLSDFDGEATRGFGVGHTSRGMADVALRSAFLVADGTVTAAWLLRSEMPDVDAVISAAAT